MKPTMKLTIIATSMAAALATANAQATLVNTGFVAPNPPGCGTPETGLCAPLSTDSANFTMLDPGGYMVGGTNDVHMAWDGTAYTSSSDYIGPGGASNVTMSSTTAFFGVQWTAHDIQVFVPGSYTFDVTAGHNQYDTETGTLSATVGAGQFGMHMLFDWNVSRNIDVFVILNPNSVFGAGIANSTNLGCGYSLGDPTVSNCLWDGPGYGSAGKPAGSKIWGLASVDGNGDGLMGIPMAAGGPFEGFNANFNAYAPVPVPAAFWLFGSGLVGLFGVARRRKTG